MGKIKVLHIASFNGNIGDNANHNGFRKRLIKTLNRDCSFTNLEMREFYKSWNYRDFNSDEFIRLCNEHDLVVIGGGNFFELQWDYSVTGTTVNISLKTLDAILTPILFHGVGCDVSKGASESALEKFKIFLERITNDDNILVSVRNDGSYETIRDLYGDLFEGKVIKVPDGAFFMESKKFEFPEISDSLKSIGINVVSDMKNIRFSENVENGIRYDDFNKSFGEVLNKFLEEYENYQLILFPHIYSDLLAIYDLMENIDDKYRRTRIVIAPCLTGQGADEYIFGLYKECEFIMGMRFHTNVCSIAQNIPTIALNSYKKIRDLYNELGLESRVVDVNKIGFEESLRVLIKNTINDRESIVRDYSEVNQKILSQSSEFYDKVYIWYRKQVRVK